ncbi:MAG: AMIN domain-containing protein, partial [Roseibium sp.]|uniref:AMIN domain-containing protein n=1 Tax=Roseibium sp. TaxID=1936156 RepID=UPI00260BC375
MLTALFVVMTPALTGSIRTAVAETVKPLVSGARVAGDETRTRFVLDMDSQVVPAISGLSNPYRLIMDLPEVTFDLPEDTGKSGRGLIADWRYGLFALGKSRVVMDLTDPVSVDKTFFLPAVDDQPARLVVDLVRSTPEEFEAFVVSSRPAVVGNTRKKTAKSDRLTAPKNNA